MNERMPKIPPRGYKPMADAPLDRTIILKTWRGKSFPARWRDGFLDSEERDCGCWTAEEEGNHPACWDDGVCWESNADGMHSEQPIGWKEVA